MAWVTIWENRQLLLNGFLFTLNLTVVTVATSTVLGFIVGLIRYWRVPVLDKVCALYLSVFRGSPLLIQILFIYYGAAYLSQSWMTKYLAVAAAITLHQGSYISEVFRAGMINVPAGQLEAAKSLGMKRSATFIKVVLPQSLKVAIAPLFGQYIALVKGTALASVIGSMDLIRQGRGVIDQHGFPFEVYGLIALMYFIISYPMSLAATHFERKDSLKAEAK